MDKGSKTQGGEMSDKGYKDAIAYARGLGEEHGKGAAEWWAQETFTRTKHHDAQEVGDHAYAILRSLEEGDPEIMDSLPRPDLSGEWSDEMTADELVKDAFDHAGMLDWAMGGEMFANSFDEICDAYEQSFDIAVQNEVYRACQYQLGEE